MKRRDFLQSGLLLGATGLLPNVSIAARGLDNSQQTVKSTAPTVKAGDRMVLTVKGIEHPFRWCPAGSFMMGSPANEKWRWDCETQHQVTLSRGFWMLETTVTQAMWEIIAGNNTKRFKGAQLPMVDVSWNDCQVHVKQLNDLGVAPNSYRFSLPTEAQWEYACRAGTTTAFHFDNSLCRKQANFGEIYVRQERRASVVGSYPANAWGLYDMHGNVWEWCLDWYGNYPSGSVSDPVGTPSDPNRVLRGGSWYNLDGHCRSAFRHFFDPSASHFLIGFRISLVFAETG